ncbi:BCCT family transporter, partial [Nocardioides sp.]|uniref:BCCT family transporter n=1 Tax=Nocardioides sp. TaxID=35761 RepID=UPI00273487CE
MSTQLTSGAPVSDDAPASASRSESGAPGSPSSGRLGTVFWTSVGVAAIFIAWATFFTQNLNEVTGTSLNWVTSTFGWSYLVVTLGILVFLVFLA